MSDVVVVIGAGSIGQAIARRVSAGKHVVLADLRSDNAGAAAEVMLDAGFEVSTATVDVSSRPSVHALVRRLLGSATSRDSSTPQGSHPVKPPQRPFSPSICTERPSFLRSSEMS